MSNEVFSGGSISMRVVPESASENPTAQILVSYDPATSEMFTAGMMGLEAEASFVFSLYRAGADAGGWTAVARTISAQREPNLPLDLRLEARGSILDLHANNVHVLRHTITGRVPTKQCGVYFRSRTPIRLEHYSIEPMQRTAFVVMQFSDQYNELYKQVITPVADSLSVKAIRADEIPGPGMIIADIIKHIKNADIIIAEISPTNANVFYEVGFASALDKPIILIAEKGVSLPFDISPFRTLFYENSIAGKRKFEDGLRTHISAILQP